MMNLSKFIIYDEFIYQYRVMSQEIIQDESSNVTDIIPAEFDNSSEKESDQLTLIWDHV
jgi:hypothetical protein